METAKTDFSRMLGCLDDPTAELQALGHLVVLFSLKRAGLGC
jgi:hypothetical protein